MQLFARHRVLSEDRQYRAADHREHQALRRNEVKGVAIVPRMCVEREAESGVLRVLRLRQMSVVRRLYLVYRQDRPLSAAAEKLLQILGNAVRKRETREESSHRKAAAR